MNPPSTAIKTSAVPVQSTRVSHPERSPIFQAVETAVHAVEAAEHAFVGALRDEVDTLFHELHHHDHPNVSNVVSTSTVSSQPRSRRNQATPFKVQSQYPYGWGMP